MLSRCDDARLNDTTGGVPSSMLRMVGTPRDQSGWATPQTITNCGAAWHAHITGDIYGDNTCLGDALVMQRGEAPRLGYTIDYPGGHNDWPADILRPM